MTPVLGKALPLVQADIQALASADLLNQYATWLTSLLSTLYGSPETM